MSQNHDDDILGPGTSEGSTSPEMIDERTDAILLDVSLTAHDHVKSITKELTQLLRRPGPRIRFVPRPTSDRKQGKDIPQRIKDAYRSRLHPHSAAEEDAFAKDYARIIHSPSFRKLQGKSQLIPAGENYFFRTRLTHSLEVAEIATRIARKLVADGFPEEWIDFNLITCAALLHDIGHPPFGHSGEEALNRKMEGDFGGFEGNAQTLRLITRLENRLGGDRSVREAHDDPRGLNLAVGTLASILKYDKVYNPHVTGVQKAFYEDDEKTVASIKARLGLAPDEHLSTIECQIMDIADDIAYSAYDLEDTMEAGIVTPFDFISVDDDMIRRIQEDVSRQYRKRNGHGEFDLTRGEVLQELAKVFATILVYAEGSNAYNMNEWTHRAVFVGRSHLEAIMHAKDPLIRRQFLETLIQGNINAISVPKVDWSRPFLSKLNIRSDRLKTIEVMKSFNYHKVILSRKFQVPRYRGGVVVEGLFDIFDQDVEGNLFPEPLRTHIRGLEKNDRIRKRLIADRISALTDAEAMRLYNQLRGGRDSSLFEYDE